MAVADALLKQFELDEFVFVPAFHAPHKKGRPPTPAYDRFAMLCLATQKEAAQSVSRIEIEMPEKPYSVETLARIIEMLPKAEIFFVMGADSWMDITTWKDWQTVLTISNHIVVTRPGVKIGFDHVTDEIRERIVDLREGRGVFRSGGEIGTGGRGGNRIFFTDAVNVDLSATEVRQQIRDGVDSWRHDVPVEVANYIEKYQIYT